MTMTSEYQHDPDPGSAHDHRDLGHGIGGRAHSHDLRGASKRSLTTVLVLIAARGFGIGHITLQVVQSLDDCTEHHHVDHLHARTAGDA